MIMPSHSTLIQVGKRIRKAIQNARPKYIASIGIRKYKECITGTPKPLIKPRPGRKIAVYTNIIHTLI